ncbi:MAG: FtsH protease activity modulator HflK, partial [Betaproteobacteria bacterium]|nr:FtsH protease activity modulator HflK [Betaproteobacteria bacterium]
MLGLGKIFQRKDGPPDLDEIVEKFMQQMGFRSRRQSLEMFRRGGEGDGEQPPGGGLLIPPGMLAVLVSSMALLVIMISGFYTVDESERALTFRLGKPIGVNEPGLRWRIPFIDDYRIVNLTGVRTVEVGYRNNARNKIARESLMLSDNLNIIDLQFAVQYLLKNPEDYLYNNRDPENAVLQVAETAMREVVGRNNIDYVLYEGREQIAADTELLMQEILDYYRTGILIRQVAIQNVQPPDQVQDAFEDAIRARQDYERKINEGEAYANDIIPKAEGQKARILEDAEAYRFSTVAKSKGEAERFRLLAEQYAAAPRVTRQRLYLETVQEVFKSTGKII